MLLLEQKVGFATGPHPPAAAAADVDSDDNLYKEPVSPPSSLRAGREGKGKEERLVQSWSLSMEQLEVPEAVWDFVRSKAALCNPKDVFLCDGSEAQAAELTARMLQQGMLKPLPKYTNWYITHLPSPSTVLLQTQLLWN